MLISLFKMKKHIVIGISPSSVTFAKTLIREQVAAQVDMVDTKSPSFAKSMGWQVKDTPVYVHNDANAQDPNIEKLFDLAQKIWVVADSKDSSPLWELVDSDELYSEADLYREFAKHIPLVGVVGPQRYNVVGMMVKALVAAVGKENIFQVRNGEQRYIPDAIAWADNKDGNEGEKVVVPLSPIQLALPGDVYPLSQLIILPGTGRKTGTVRPILSMYAHDHTYSSVDEIADYDAADIVRLIKGLSKKAQIMVSQDVGSEIKAAVKGSAAQVFWYGDKALGQEQEGIWIHGTQVRVSVNDEQETLNINLDEREHLQLDPFYWLQYLPVILSAHLQGVSDANITKIIHRFNGVSGRMEIVDAKEKQKLPTIVNDVASANATDLVETLGTFTAPKILIVNNAAKPADLLDQITKGNMADKNISRVIAVNKGAFIDANSYMGAFEKAGVEVVEVDSVQDGLAKALDLAEAKDAIILSSGGDLFEDITNGVKKNRELFGSGGTLLKEAVYAHVHGVAPKHEEEDKELEEEQGYEDGLEGEGEEGLEDEDEKEKELEDEEELGDEGLEYEGEELEEEDKENENENEELEEEYKDKDEMVLEAPQRNLALQPQTELDDELKKRLKQELVRGSKTRLIRKWFGDLQASSNVDIDNEAVREQFDTSEFVRLFDIDNRHDPSTVLVNNDVRNGQFRKLREEKTEEEEGAYSFSIQRQPNKIAKGLDVHFNNAIDDLEIDGNDVYADKDRAFKHFNLAARLSLLKLLSERYYVYDKLEALIEKSETVAELSDKVTRLMAVYWQTASHDVLAKLKLDRWLNNPDSSKVVRESKREKYLNDQVVAYRLWAELTGHSTEFVNEETEELEMKGEPEKVAFDPVKLAKAQNRIEEIIGKMGRISDPQDMLLAVSNFGIRFTLGLHEELQAALNIDLTADKVQLASVAVQSEQKAAAGNEVELRTGGGVPKNYQGVSMQSSVSAGPPKIDTEAYLERKKRRTKKWEKSKPVNETPYTHPLLQEEEEKTSLPPVSPPAEKLPVTPPVAAKVERPAAVVPPSLAPETEQAEAKKADDTSDVVVKDTTVKREKPVSKTRAKPPKKSIMKEGARLDNGESLEEVYGKPEEFVVQTKVSDKGKLLKVIMLQLQANLYGKQDDEQTVNHSFQGHFYGKETKKVKTRTASGMLNFLRVAGLRNGQAQESMDKLLISAGELDEGAKYQEDKELAVKNLIAGYIAKVLGRFSVVGVDLSSGIGASVPDKQANELRDAYQFLNRRVLAPLSQGLVDISDEPYVLKERLIRVRKNILQGNVRDLTADTNWHDESDFAIAAVGFIAEIATKIEEVSAYLGVDLKKKDFLLADLSRVESSIKTLRPVSRPNRDEEVVEESVEPIPVVQKQEPSAVEVVEEDEDVAAYEVDNNVAVAEGVVGAVEAENVHEDQEEGPEEISEEIPAEALTQETGQEADVSGPEVFGLEDKKRLYGTLYNMIEDYEGKMWRIDGSLQERYIGGGSLQGGVYCRGAGSWKKATEEGVQSFSEGVPLAQRFEKMHDCKKDRNDLPKELDLRDYFAEYSLEVLYRLYKLGENLHHGWFNKDGVEKHYQQIWTILADEMWPDVAKSIEKVGVSGELAEAVQGVHNMLAADVDYELDDTIDGEVAEYLRFIHGLVTDIDTIAKTLEFERPQVSLKAAEKAVVQPEMNGHSEEALEVEVPPAAPKVPQAVANGVDFVGARAEESRPEQPQNGAYNNRPVATNGAKHEPEVTRADSLNGRSRGHVNESAEDLLSLSVGAVAASVLDIWHGVVNSLSEKSEDDDVAQMIEAPVLILDLALSKLQDGFIDAYPSLDERPTVLVEDAVSAVAEEDLRLVIAAKTAEYRLSNLSEIKKDINDFKKPEEVYDNIAKVRGSFSVLAGGEKALLLTYAQKARI